MAKQRNGKLSGKIRGEVYVNDPHGQVVRGRPSRCWHSTPRRGQAKQILAAVASQWHTLTRIQFAAWTAAGQKVKMKGYRLFCKINCALLAAGLPMAMDPPKREKIQPNPVGDLEILNRGGAITMRVRVPQAPAEYTFLLGAPPCSRGYSVPRRQPSIIGRLPEAVGGWSDITEVYVQAYGVPQVGLQVFIQTRQLINGWEDDLKQTCADVPPPE